MSKLLANQIANYGDDAPIEIKEGLNIPAGKPIQAAGSAGTSGQVLSTTGTSIAWVDSFDGNYNSLSNRPSIPAAQVPADWDAVSGVARILNKPLVPPLPSVTTASASGGGTLSYNGVNGEFTFAPADLSNASNWDTAYEWGNHANAGYLTAEADTINDVVQRGNTTGTQIIANGGVRGGTLSSGTSNDVQLSHNNSTHKSTLQHLNTWSNFDIKSVTDINIIGGITEGGSVNLSHTVNAGDNPVVRLSTTDFGLTINGSVELGSGNLTTTGKLLYANNYDNLGDLPGASTYHGMFAHVHNEGHGYFAHAGAWTQLLDTGSSIGDTSDVDLSVAPSDGYVLKWDASSSSWKAQPDLVGSGGSGIVLGDLSVSTQSASGGGSLSYGNTTGVFTYTPPDLSGFLTAETDPVYSASPAAGILSSNIANWDAAYGWGNHATAGYLTAVSLSLNSLTDVSFNQANLNSGDGLIWSGTGWVATTQQFITTESDPVFSASEAAAITSTNISNWNSAYGWGDHSGAGYLTTVALNSISDVTITAPSTNDVLTYNGSGWVNSAPTSGGGGANVTISDTIPAGTPAAGDLWWESDTGRLKVYYTDTDSSQWVDASPPLTQDRIASSSAPSSASDTGTPGDIRYDSGYVYICIANNTWKRAALATW